MLDNSKKYSEALLNSINGGEIDGTKPYAIVDECNNIGRYYMVIIYKKEGNSAYRKETIDEVKSFLKENSIDEGNILWLLTTKDK